MSRFDCTCSFQSVVDVKLENVFVKHYAPHHMPDPKRQVSVLKHIDKYHSKVNQLINLSSPMKFQNPSIHASSVMRHPNRNICKV